MRDLRMVLHGVGLASDRQFREAEASRQLDLEAEANAYRKTAAEQDRRMEILHSSNSPDQFRREARRLLLQFPSLVQQIVNIAHERGMQKKTKQGGGRLIANLLQVRAALSKGSLSDEDRVKIVGKLFPKH